MVKRTYLESLLLLPRGYGLRYCLLTCLLLLRDSNKVGLPPPPNPKAGTAPGDPPCGCKGYAWAAPGFCLSAEKVVTTTPRTPAGSVAPQSPGPRMGRTETGSARRGRGEHEMLLPHTAAVTPESLRSRLDGGGIRTPRGGMGAHDEAAPHTAAVSPESHWPCVGRGGIGKPRGGFGGHTEPPPPPTAAVTPESLRSCLDPGGIGTPRGGLGARGDVPPPHSGGYT